VNAFIREVGEDDIHCHESLHYDGAPRLSPMLDLSLCEV
jgi:hypothetical protein